MVVLLVVNHRNITNTLVSMYCAVCCFYEMLRAQLRVLYKDRKGLVDVGNGVSLVMQFIKCELIIYNQDLLVIQDSNMIKKKKCTLAGTCQGSPPP